MYSYDRTPLTIAVCVGRVPLVRCAGTVPLLDGAFDRFRPGSRRDFWRAFWPLYVQSWTRWLAPGRYCNSMVSRPDALDPARWPAIGFFTPRWKAVFAGKRVLLVRGAASGAPGAPPLTRDRTVFDRHLADAAHVVRLRRFPISREQNLFVGATGMFAHYVALRNEVLRVARAERADVVALSLGPTATVMAAELACRGLHAIDVGQFGGNFTKKEKKKKRHGHG